MRAGATHRALVAGHREHLIARHPAVHDDKPAVDEGERVPGHAEPGHPAAGHVVLAAHPQPVRVHSAELHAARERHDGVQPGRVQRHVQQELGEPLSPQQRALLPVPHLDGLVQLAARDEHRFPVAHGQAAHAAPVQRHAERLDRHLRRMTETNQKPAYRSQKQKK